MEVALIKLKQRNDELNAKTRDITDGQPEEQSPSPTTVKANEEFEQIKEEVESQSRDHNERIVEMVSYRCDDCHSALRTKKYGHFIKVRNKHPVHVQPLC